MNASKILLILVVSLLAWAFCACKKAKGQASVLPAPTIVMPAFIEQDPEILAATQKNFDKLMAIQYTITPSRWDAGLRYFLHADKPLSIAKISYAKMSPQQQRENAGVYGHRLMAEDTVANALIFFKQLPNDATVKTYLQEQLFEKLSTSQLSDDEILATLSTLDTNSFAEGVSYVLTESNTNIANAGELQHFLRKIPREKISEKLMLTLFQNEHVKLNEDEKAELIQSLAQ